MNAKTATLTLIFSIALAGCAEKVQHQEQEQKKQEAVVVAPPKVYSGPFPKQHNNALELLDLLEKFTSSNNDWAIEEGNMHIDWITDVEIGSRKIPEYVDRNFSKRAKLHILMNDEFSDYYHRKRNIPVPWTINMYGSRTMWDCCMLKTEITGIGNSMTIEDYLKEQKVLVELSCYKEKSDSPGWGTNQYTKLKIKLKSGRIIYVIHEALYMNNVCDQAIYFNYDGSEDIPLPPDFNTFNLNELMNCQQ